MSEKPTRQLFADYVIPCYGRYDVVFVRGEGTRVWDEDGKEYLDFGAGIAVNALGHAHPNMAKALEQQARTLIHTSNIYYTRPQGELAEHLVGLVGAAGKIFFSNSGAEANEALIKMARKYGNECVGDASDEPKRFEILTFDQSFHGRTMAGISATGQAKVKVGFEPLLEGFSHLPFNDLAAVERAISKQTVAVLVEAIQGEGGIRPATPEFLIGLREICDRHRLLLLFDEIQCGLGRVGDYCAWKKIAPRITPDGVSWAKGIGGGFPLGASWVRKKPVEKRSGVEIDLCDLLQPGTHATTYGGTPLACTVSLAVLRTVEREKLLENAERQGAYAMERLGQVPGVKEVRGFGLLIGVELKPESEQLATSGRLASQVVVSALLQNGLLAVPAGARVIRLLPPLNVTRAEVDQALGIFASTLAELKL